MLKKLNAYLTIPSPTNAKRVVDHFYKFPMSACLLTIEEMAVVTRLATIWGK